MEATSKAVVQARVRGDALSQQARLTCLYVRRQSTFWPPTKRHIFSATLSVPLLRAAAGAVQAFINISL